MTAERVSGGYMHKMYCLRTEKVKFAVKLLNPEVMKRPDVFANYRTAELLEKKLEDAGMPVVTANEFRGEKMQHTNGRYYYVFDWIDGKALESDSITKKHCEIVGTLLARMHNIERREELPKMKELCIPWNQYSSMASQKCPEIASLLDSNEYLLYHIQSKGNAAYKSIPPVTCISNGDMDSKNVLWLGEKPYIIDLECLSYGSPFVEMFQLGLYWSGYECCAIDYERLNAFVSGYCSEYGNIQFDWETLYDSNCGSLNWLEYNIKRALLLECEDQNEQGLGIEQVKQTLKNIVYYHSIKDELLCQLNQYATRKEPLSCRK
jgi:Ser/Thr protein kinase RdoA (MazF antagonist)